MSNIQEIIQEVAAQLVTDSLGLTYEKLAEQRDAEEIIHLREEIDNIVKRTGNGVLMRRITIMIHAEGGNNKPEYAGLMVAGRGDSYDESIQNHHSSFRKRQLPSLPQSVTICTSLNPTGEKSFPRAEMRSAPEGYNHGYASQLADKITKSLNINPKILGKFSLENTILRYSQLNIYMNTFFS